MAFSTQRVTSDGTLDYLDLSIDYLSRDDIQVFYDGLPADDATWDWVGATESAITFTPDVPLGVEVLIQRASKLDNLIHIFTQGAAFNNSTLDEDFLQLLFLVQESVEGSGITDIFNDVDYHGNRIINLGVAINPTDAVSLGQATSVTSAFADAAEASALDAADSAALAQRWAIETALAIEPGLFGAKYYAEQAALVLANTVQTNVANIFTMDQFIKKVDPALLLESTTTTPVNDTEVGRVGFRTNATGNVGEKASFAAFFDGVVGAMKMRLMLGAATVMQWSSTEAQLNTPLIIDRLASGPVVAPPSATTLVLRGAASSGSSSFLNFQSGAAAEGGLYFGDTANSAAGNYKYSHVSDAHIWAVSATQCAFLGTGGLVVATGAGPSVGLNTNTGAFLSTGSLSSQFSRSANPAVAIQRSTSDGAVLHTYRDTVNVGSIAVTATATAYNTSSDYRLKTNVADLTGSYDFISALRPRSYDWVCNGERGVGFIAHELAEVSPSSVTGEKDAVDTAVTEVDGDIVVTEVPVMQCVEYGSAEVIAHLVNAVAQLIQENIDMHNRLEALENAA